MTRRTITSTNSTSPRRHCRTPRPLALLAVLPEERTAEAMDDERAAEQLMSDLLALVETGLVAPIQQGGVIRYAPEAPDAPAEPAAPEAPDAPGAPADPAEPDAPAA
jgi:hypothetical protein